jgi:hypothetical protein
VITLKTPFGKNSDAISVYPARNAAGISTFGGGTICADYKRSKYRHLKRLPLQDVMSVEADIFFA